MPAERMSGEEKKDIEGYRSKSPDAAGSDRGEAVSSALTAVSAEDQQRGADLRLDASGDAPARVKKSGDSLMRVLSMVLSRLADLHVLNTVLVIVLAVVALVSLPVFLRRSPDLSAALEEKVKREALPRRSGVEKRPELDYFTGKMGGRNIFAPALREDAPVAEEGAAGQGPKLEEIKGQLNLLGILGGDTPQAIIEDKRNQKSYFLTKDGSFDDIRVKEILENKVILVYKGQEFELSL
ncbi:MAG: hypothetical protein WCG78_01800 [Candidatus Omnitrophota bacterium]